MTTVPLAVLLRERDESLSVRAPARPGWIVRTLARVREWEWARVMTLLVTLAAFTQRHGLVVGALISFVVAASLVSTVLAWVVAGVALLFLEVRRKN